MPDEPRPRTARPHPCPHPRHPRTRQGRPAAGEAPGGHRHQALVGGLRHHGRLRTGDARSPDRPANATPGSWRTWPSAGCAAGPPPSPRPSPGASASTTPSWPGSTWTNTDQLTTMLEQLTARIEEAIRPPFVPCLDLLATVPGISRAVAEVIVAETGGDMTRFPTAKHLASWAGVCPGHHESAGRTKNAKVRPGNPLPQRCPGHRRHGSCPPHERLLPSGPLPDDSPPGAAP